MNRIEYSNEQLARIYGMYWLSPVMNEDGRICRIARLADDNTALLYWIESEGTKDEEDMLDGWNNLSDLKLLLRPITSLTDDEKVKWYDVVGDKSKKDISDILEAVNQWASEYRAYSTLHPSEFLYLTSIGIDLYGLLESGYAIDNTTKK